MSNIKATIPVYISVYEHGHGMDIFASATPDAQIRKKADISREYWEDRHDLDAPDNHTNLNDQEVCDAYFEANENEFWTIDKVDVEIDLLSISNFKSMYEHLQLVARLKTTDDFDVRGACMENDDAVDTVNRLIIESREIISMTDEQYNSEAVQEDRKSVV